MPPTPITHLLQRKRALIAKNIKWGCVLGLETKESVKTCGTHTVPGLLGLSFAAH